MKNYYKILKVNKDSTKEEIKKNYHKLSLKYHPDKNHGDRESTARFKDISEAYTILSDDQSRDIYDMELLFDKIEMTDEDYALLLSYYNKIINSKEYKLFKLLYDSIPAKDEIWLLEQPIL